MPRVGFLGPEGTFSHQALLSATGLGADVEPVALADNHEAGAMQGMDHSNMPGMNHGNMQGMSGMQGHNMSGMNMQDMMAHCRQMQADAIAGRPIPPDMQSMMAHCNMMGGSSQGRSRSR